MLYKPDIKKDVTALEQHHVEHEQTSLISISAVCLFFKALFHSAWQNVKTIQILNIYSSRADNKMSLINSILFLYNKEWHFKIRN